MSSAINTEAQQERNKLHQSKLGELLTFKTSHNKIEVESNWPGRFLKLQFLLYRKENGLKFHEKSIGANRCSVKLHRYIARFLGFFIFGADPPFWSF